MFLYEEINSLRKFGSSIAFPQYLIDNLSDNIKLRDYQKDAIINTLLYLNSDIAKKKQIHLLYHMATGSGKTVIMALDILHFYNLGYEKERKKCLFGSKIRMFPRPKPKVFTVCVRYNICLAVKEIVLQRNFRLKTDLR